MTTGTPPHRPVDPALLDRLVDGELDGPQREALLRALDVEPGAWRRCAMAFLEAQALQRALVQLGSAASHPAPLGKGSRLRPLRVPFLTGIAAAVVVAFVTGFVSRGLTGRPGHSGGDGSASHFARDDRGPDSPTSLPTDRRASPGETEPPLQIPVLVADANSADEMLRQPSALPEYVRLQLQRRGYEVEGDRKLMSVALKDGRSVTLPVETFKYRYVGYRVH